MLVTVCNFNLSGQCVTGNTTCPTISPQAVFNVCQNAGLTINSNVVGGCTRPKCCYNSATSNLSLTVIGTHTYVSDLRYWVLNGTGPEGNRAIVLYNAGNNNPSGTSNPVTTNDFTGNCNSNNNFNLTFSFSAASTMPSFCNFTTNNPALSGSYRPETAETTLDGIDINAYNWSVQIYDCVGADVGAISSISITITNTQCNNQCSGCGGSATAGTVTSTNTTSIPITDNSCSSTTAATIVAQPALPTPTRTVVWNGPGVSNVVGNSLSPSTATVGTFQYTAKVRCDGIDCAPCTNNACGTPNIASVTVNVNAPPNIAATNNGPICAGKNLQLFTGGGTSYQWTGPNAFTSTSQNPIITSATTAASGTYLVTVTNSAGCTAVFSTVATVNTLPATPTISGGPQFCPGTNLTIDAGAGYSSYLWSNSGNTQAITVNTPGTYTVTVANAFGCTITANKAISHFNIPNFNSPITFTCPVNGGDAASTYNFTYAGTWSVINSPSGTNPTVNGSGQVTGMILPGSYEFGVITSDNCSVAATINIPVCCPVPNCIPINILRVNN